jgi:Protein of unknown function (DUF1997)
MQASSMQYQTSSALSTHSPLIDQSDIAAADSAEQESDRILFEGYYVGQMEMYADSGTVANYLDSHQGWFTRCAQPMRVEQIAKNGYALILGRFGSLNFELEPKIGLHLLPQDQGIYRIETIPVPGYDPKVYDVDFKASMTLAEKTDEALPVECATHVEWELKLLTWVQMPRFIQALPQSIVKASGDKLLNQIVKQISRRLTLKVQEDFHTMCNLPIPGKKSGFWNR